MSGESTQRYALPAPKALRRNTVKVFGIAMFVDGVQGLFGSDIHTSDMCRQRYGCLR
jgi:hypothetical protein